MRVAFLIPTLGAGGAERVITNMANFWAERGHRVIVFSLGAAVPSFFALHPKVRYHPLNLLEDQKGYWKKITRTVRQVVVMKKQIQQHQPDVLIARLDIAIFLAILATLGMKTKSIVSEGTNPYLSQSNQYLKKLNNFLYRFANHLVLQTHAVARTFPNHLQEKISVIYNPIAHPKFSLQSEDYVRSLAQKRIVSVGRLVFPKAYEILIKAFHRFSQENPGWSLLILGEGDERYKLETLCQKLGIDDQVSLLGTVKNPVEMLQTCSIFVLSSRYEGMPNALCEAMSVGMPVIATRCKFGPEELIQHGKNGLLVPVEDADALSEAMTTLANDPQFGERLGTNARNINRHLNIDTIMQQWEAVIVRVTGLPMSTV